MRFFSVRALIGALFVVVGALCLLDNYGIVHFDLGDAIAKGWPLVLVVIGLSILFRDRRHSCWSTSWRISKAVGDESRSFAGQEIRTLQLAHGVGNLALDLSGAVVPEGTAQVRVSLGVGELSVTLPARVAVRVNARTGLGDVQVFDKSSDSAAPRLEFVSPDYATASKRIELEAAVGLGRLRVRLPQA